MLSLLGAISVRLSEYDSSEGQAVEELNPIAYGVIAFILFLVALLVVTRLDLDR